ncbi:hypothetical protein [Streptomyces kanamyceticus]|uniref:hypothetical protein n=1 Tax=Streptomyces kanamyceticus TaxID=1967 RepID=UPI00123E30EE|nr:hypothetical protein [Streptomyces kanamyceticus]
MQFTERPPKASGEFRPEYAIGDRVSCRTAIFQPTRDVNSAGRVARQRSRPSQVPQGQLPAQSFEPLGSPQTGPGLTGGTNAPGENVDPRGRRARHVLVPSGEGHHGVRQELPVSRRTNEVCYLRIRHASTLRVGKVLDQAFRRCSKMFRQGLPAEAYHAMNHAQRGRVARNGGKK